MNTELPPTTPPLAASQLIDYVIFVVKYCAEPSAFDDDDQCFDESSDEECSDEFSGSVDRLGFQVATSRAVALKLFSRAKGYATVERYTDWLSDFDTVSISLEVLEAQAHDYDEDAANARFEAEREEYLRRNRPIDPGDMGRPSIN